MILPVTLAAAAAAAITAVWLAARVGAIRRREHIAHGDGDHPLLARRMRAQLNFVEYTPFVLLLCAAIELAGKGGAWLAAVMALYMLGRIAHAFGMDGEVPPATRMIGIAVTFLMLFGLAAVAALVAAGVL